MIGFILGQGKMNNNSDSIHEKDEINKSRILKKSQIDDEVSLLWKQYHSEQQRKKCIQKYVVIFVLACVILFVIIGLYIVFSTASHL